MPATLTHDATDSQGRTYDVRGNYRYRIKATRSGSASLGPCEVCHKHADIMYLQTAQRRYGHNGEHGWTENGCRALFGHEACLIGTRREG